MMKKFWMIATLSTLLVGCNITEVVKMPEVHLTRAELNEQTGRQKNMILYKDYLGSQETLITDEPYDIVQQMVYSTLPEREEVYNVRLYSVVDSVADPSYIDVLGKTPHLQHVAVTKESELPEVIMENLEFGYYGIELDGLNYILEVLYEKVELEEWEKSYGKMLELEKDKPEPEVEPEVKE